MNTRKDITYIKKLLKQNNKRFNIRIYKNLCAFWNPDAVADNYIVCCFYDLKKEGDKLC